MSYIRDKHSVHFKIKATHANLIFRGNTFAVRNGCVSIANQTANNG